MNLRAFSALLVATAATVAASGALAGAARAQEPAPTDVADLGLDTDAVLGLLGPDPVIGWRPLAGAASYRLTASLHALRVNRADPFCTPPIQADTRTIAADETLGGTVTELPVDLPAILEGDAWFVSSVRAALRAYDGDGREIGAQIRGGVAESTCARQAVARAGSMTVTALVPAPPGTDVRLEALDVPTVKSVLCASGTSTAEAGAAPGAASSRVTFVVDKARCVDPHSGNLRICWSAAACATFDYQEGVSKDLGLLSTTVTYSVPSVGDGALAGQGGRSGRAQLAHGLLALLGLTLVAAGAVATARRRWLTE